MGGGSFIGALVLMGLFTGVFTAIVAGVGAWAFKWKLARSYDPERARKTAWAAMCVLFVAPALTLLMLNLVLDGHQESGEVILRLGALFASFVSGPGGIMALLFWEFNFPFSPDWGYLGVMTLSACLLWTLIWTAGEFWKIRGKPVRWWVLVGVVPIFYVCLVIQLIYLIAKHT